jgi:nicotinamidase-related amidase
LPDTPAAGAAYHENGAALQKDWRNAMTSLPVRDQVQDHLLTPKNSALIIIDYQPVQVGSIASMDRHSLVENIVAVARTARLYGVPVVLSTVNVRTGRSEPTIHQLTDVLGDIEAFDRTTINAWEDAEFVGAVEATGRKKLIMAALWTEACLTFPTLDALREGYEVYPVVDAVGGTSLVAHQAALERMTQAGAQPISWVQLLCELQRDWSRTETAKQSAEILFTVGGR